VCPPESSFFRQKTQPKKRPQEASNNTQATSSNIMSPPAAQPDNPLSPRNASLSQSSQPKKRPRTRPEPDIEYNGGRAGDATWFYNPVDITWQRSRAQFLQLEVTDSSIVDPRNIGPKLYNQAPTIVYSTGGQGDCFYRAISHYICGNEEAHVILRRLVVEHMRRNRDQFMAVNIDPAISATGPIKQRQRKFEAFLMKNVVPSREWAKADMMMGMSSLLRTGIQSYAPVPTYLPNNNGTILLNKWVPINAEAAIGPTVYNSVDAIYLPSEKQIVLNNLGDHFEPAGF